jgi:hypothetical protein
VYFTKKIEFKCSLRDENEFDDDAERSRRNSRRSMDPDALPQIVERIELNRIRYDSLPLLMCHYLYSVFLITPHIRSAINYIGHVMDSDQISVASSFSDDHGSVIDTVSTDEYEENLQSMFQGREIRLGRTFGKSTSRLPRQTF